MAHRGAEHAEHRVADELSTVPPKCSTVRFSSV
jgi:hypothetical protein